MTVSKRRASTDVESGSKSLKPSVNDKGHTYAGYRIPEMGTSLDRLSIDSISNREFQEKYILPHKPCIITGVIPELDISKFELPSIEETLEYDEDLQVEKKIDGGFGSGHERLRMKFSEFMDKLRNGDNSLYLTTQYSDDEESNDEDDEAEENEKGFLEDGDFSETDSIDLNNLQDDFVDSEEEKEDDQDGYKEEVDPSSVLQPPLTNSDAIPLEPALFDILIPQQINLWVGSSKPKSTELAFDDSKPFLGVGRALPNNIGTSSGLHHDHSDNLYIPIKGKKRFTLFSPYDADSLYTVGDIYKVYENGVIDYDINENAPNWKHVRSDGVIIDTGESSLQKQADSTDGVKRDPPSFSRIPPFLIHLEDLKQEDESYRTALTKEFIEKFPKAVGLNKIQVELSQGEMLFLPCGWFHEVTSYGNDDGIHIALNYWFVPSDNNDIDKPYQRL